MSIKYQLCRKRDTLLFKTAKIRSQFFVFILTPENELVTQLSLLTDSGSQSKQNVADIEMRFKSVYTDFWFIEDTFNSSLVNITA
jgi:hypothetical protein